MIFNCFIRAKYIFDKLFFLHIGNKSFFLITQLKKKKKKKRERRKKNKVLLHKKEADLIFIYFMINLTTLKHYVLNQATKIFCHKSVKPKILKIIPKI
jgi:hypothetical protein